jgi:hypothetical protein
MIPFATLGMSRSAHAWGSLSLLRASPRTRIVACRRSQIGQRAIPIE